VVTAIKNRWIDEVDEYINRWTGEVSSAVYTPPTLSPSTFPPPISTTPTTAEYPMLFGISPFGVTIGMEASIEAAQKGKAEEPEITSTIFKPIYTPTVSTKTTPLVGPLAKEYYEQMEIPFMEIVPFEYEAKVFGQSLTYLPKQIASSVLQATQGQGGASVVNRDWADKFIAEANEDLDKFTQSIAKQYPTSDHLYEVSQLSRNLAYSVTSMGAGAAAGIPISLIPVPGARAAAWAAGTAASGAVAYQMTTYQIMQTYLELKDAEKIEQTGKGLTQEEENKLKQDFHNDAVKYGLWEAVPEAISNLLFGQLLLGPLGKMVGGPIATQIITKLAGMYGEELLTETITQKGQSAIEVEAGLREGRINWVEAFKEIAPQTFLLTTIMAGAGQVAVSSAQGIQKVRNSLKNEIGEAHPLYDVIEQGIETELETAITPTIAESGQPFTATVYRGETTVPTDEGLVGKAQYWTTDPAYAATYGPVTQSTVELNNPLAINTQSEWDAFAARTHDLRHQAAIEERTEDWVQTELRTQIEVEGHDGVVIAEGIVETGKQVAVFHPEESISPKPAVTVAEAEWETSTEGIARRIDEGEANLEGLEASLDPRIAKLTKLMPKAVLAEGELAYITKGQYRKVWGREPKANILTPDGKRVRWEYALDELAQELNLEPLARQVGMDAGEYLKGLIEQAKRTQGLIATTRDRLVADRLALEATKPTTEPNALSIPETLPTTPPPITPIGQVLGRTDNGWRGFMADLQDANIVAEIAFRNDATRRLVNQLPFLRKLIKILYPNVVANTPSEKYAVIKATLIDEGGQKTQGVIAHLQEVGTQEEVFGKQDDNFIIKAGPLKGTTVGDIARQRGKWEGKLTPDQRLWLDRANKIEQAITEFLERHDIKLGRVSLDEGGQFATARVYARELNDGTVIEIAFVGALPGRPGAKLPTEKHRTFRTDAEALAAGYHRIPYEEALYLRASGAYRRVADKKAADWLLTQIEWRTTGAPEELILAAESANLKKRHSQMLLAALNRAVRGERVPDVTIRAIATSYPDQAQALKDLIPRLQAAEPVAKEVRNLTRVAKGLVDTNTMLHLKAVAARARAREAAITPKYGEAQIPAPAFSGKILTGPDAKEITRTVMDSFSPKFSAALGEINKFNALVRYFLLAGDISYPFIQLIFMTGENPKAYSKAFGGAIHSIFDTKFHDSQIAKFKDVIDRHPNMMLSIRGRTEFTEAMARGGLLSGEVTLFPQGENYLKTFGFLVPRTFGKVGAKLLTPFQRGMESALDLAGIYLALANEHMAKTPAELTDLDQWINEFRGLTSAARIGVTGIERQRERGLVLAPQYNRAIAGLIWSVFRGGLRGKLARRSLARGITALSIMALLFSILRGEDEEEIIEHFNPNSSNFFTWDIAGQKIGPGSKVRSLIKLFAQSARDPDDLLEFSMDNPALRFARGNLSPAVGSAIDLITGRSYIGDPTRDGLLSFSREVIAGNLLPIWVQSTLLEGGTLGGRSARGLAEFFGWRAYPEPLWDEVGKLRDKYAKQDFNKKYEDLNRAQIDKLKDNHPDLDDLEERARLEQAERGNEKEQGIYYQIETSTTDRNDALEKAATLLLNGTISKYDYDKERGYARAYYSGAMGAIYGLRDRLDPKAIKDIQEWILENQKPEDKALDVYQEYRAELIKKAELPRDWDEIEKQCETFLLKYSKKIQDYVRANLNRWINDLPENAKQVELMRLQGIEDETWWDDYRGAAVEDRWGGEGSSWGEQSANRWE